MCGVLCVHCVVCSMCCTLCVVWCALCVVCTVWYGVLGSVKFLKQQAVTHRTAGFNILLISMKEEQPLSRKMIKKVNS